MTDHFAYADTGALLGATPVVETGLLAWPRPPAFDPDLEVWALGDVHGRADALALALKTMAATPRMRRRRTFVHLGDAVDRGPGGVRALGLLARAAEFARADDAVLLPGNHELMFLDAAMATHAPHEPGFEQGMNDLELWVMNGGHAVLDEVETRLGAFPYKNDEGRARADWWAAFFDLPEAAAWLKAFTGGPNHHRVGDALFVHAGLPHRMDAERALAEGRRAHTRNHNHWAWVRAGFIDAPGPREDGLVVVHGHTVAFKKVPLRHYDDKKMLKNMDRVADKGRLNLDAGAAQREHVGFARLTDQGYALYVAQPEA